MNRPRIKLERTPGVDCYKTHFEGEICKVTFQPKFEVAKIALKLFRCHKRAFQFKLTHQKFTLLTKIPIKPCPNLCKVFFNFVGNIEWPNFSKKSFLTTFTN